MSLSNSTQSDAYTSSTEKSDHHPLSSEDREFISRMRAMFSSPAPESRREQQPHANQYGDHRSYTRPREENLPGVPHPKRQRMYDEQSHYHRETDARYAGYENRTQPDNRSFEGSKKEAKKKTIVSDLSEVFINLYNNIPDKSKAEEIFFRILSHEKETRFSSRDKSTELPSANQAMRTTDSTNAERIASHLSDKDSEGSKKEMSDKDSATDATEDKDSSSEKQENAKDSENEDSDVSKDNSDAEDTSSSSEKKSQATKKRDEKGRFASKKKDQGGEETENKDSSSAQSKRANKDSSAEDRVDDTSERKTTNRKDNPSSTDASVQANESTRNAVDRSASPNVSSSSQRLPLSLFKTFSMLKSTPP